MDNVVVVGLAALLALAVGLAVRRWLVFLTTVESESMLPTLAPGQQLLTRRPATSRPLRRGDIVVVDSDELGRVIVKRVAGLPGDCLRLDDGVTYEVPPVACSCWVTTAPGRATAAAGAGRMSPSTAYSAG